MKLREVIDDAPRLAHVVASLESDRHNILAAFDVLLENLDSAKHFDRTETDVLMERLTAYRQRAADLLYQAYGSPPRPRRGNLDASRRVRGFMKRALLGVAMAATLLAGCAQEPEPGSSSASSAFDKRAEQVAQAWRSAGVNDAFVPMGDLTQAPQEGFPSDDLKIAFMEGRYTLSTTLTTDASKGTIRFADGKRLEVPGAQRGGRLPIHRQGRRRRRASLR